MCLNIEYKEGVSTQPCAESQDVVVPIHSLGSAHQEVQDSFKNGSVEPYVSEFDDKLGGDNGIKC